MGKVVGAPSMTTQSLKAFVAALGLKPVLLKIYDGLRKVMYVSTNSFRVELGGKYANFATLDDHSKRFFLYRYNDGEMHEPPVSQELIARLKGAKVFADVGAHLGYYGCIAGTVYPDLKLFLFEMNHNLVELIERNLAANKLDSAIVVNQAVSDRRKQISYADGSVDAGLSMTDAGDHSGDEGAVTAEAVSLDEFFGEKGVDPDVIKIDVQGAEMEALQGARKIIERRHPVIFLEVHPKLVGSFGVSVPDIYRFLTNNGYDQIYLINEHRKDVGRLLELDLKSGGPDHTHMLVCAKSD